MIKIERLSKSYGNKQVLNEISFSIEKGKIYGIVGENGAGKTTLFKCIAGLEKYKGNISSEFKSLKNHLGLLFTEPFFFSKMTGKEYIQLLANARNVELNNIDDKNIFDLPLSDYVTNYSTGMKKKLNLLAVLFQHNDCYILDEPFNGVDIQSNIIIAEIIHELKNLGKTILMSSHIFSTLSETCDEIYLLKEGRIAQRVLKKDFSKLEDEMKQVSVGNLVSKLHLR